MGIIVDERACVSRSQRNSKSEPRIHFTIRVNVSHRINGGGSHSTLVNVGYDVYCNIISPETRTSRAFAKFPSARVTVSHRINGGGSHSKLGNVGYKVYCNFILPETCNSRAFAKNSVCNGSSAMPTPKAGPSGIISFYLLIFHNNPFSFPWFRILYPLQSN